MNKELNHLRLLLGISDSSSAAAAGGGGSICLLLLVVLLLDRLLTVTAGWLMTFAQS